MATFGEKLKRLRAEVKQLSMAKAAKELGIPKSTLNNWERDSSRPPLEMLCKLAAYYNTSLDFLSGHKPSPEAVELAAAIMELPEDQQESIRIIVKGLRKK